MEDIRQKITGSAVDRRASHGMVSWASIWPILSKTSSLMTASHRPVPSSRCNILRPSKTDLNPCLDEARLTPQQGEIYTPAAVRRRFAARRAFVTGASEIKAAGDGIVGQPKSFPNQSPVGPIWAFGWEEVEARLNGELGRWRRGWWPSMRCTCFGPPGRGGRSEVRPSAMRRSIMVS